MRKFIRALIIPAIFALLFFANLNLSSCTKTNTKTIYDTTTVTVRDTTIKVVKDTVAPAPSTMALLTGKQWEFDSVYEGYTGPGTGTLIYIRGASGNAADLDAFYISFTADGYVWQEANATITVGQWSFINSDSTTYKEVSTTYGTQYGRIIKLTATKLTVYDSTNSALDIEIIAP